MNWKIDVNEKDDAVTSVVGEILLMALVIILVSLFAASAFDLLPGDRQSAVDVSMSINEDTISFWHKGGDWIEGSELSASLTESDGKKHILEKVSLRDCFGDEKLVFDLGGNYTVKLPTSLPDGTVNIRLTTSDSVLYAWEGSL
ncbi:MAG: type IV pilin N-terminal domain-containing protein [Methanocorpusculum sp.]|nr:type IV pilin N-terminal domain-containing protein [Methanocorpusculum sp.]